MERALQERMLRQGEPPRGPEGVRPDVLRHPDAQRLITGLHALQVSYLFERSLQLSSGLMLPNRFLASVGRRTLGEGAVERMRTLCRQIGLPTPLWGRADALAKDTRCLHLGFEEGATSSLFKLYFELGRHDEHAAGSSTGGPFLLHVAFKWDVLGQTSPVETRYLWHRGLSVSEILRRMQAVYDGRVEHRSYQVAKRVVEQAAGRIPSDDIQFLEVAEEGGQRRSFDVNVYDAELTVADLAPALQAAARSYDLPGDTFDALLARILSERFGHVAGGRHRDGRDFLTLYYGVEACGG